MSLDALRKIIIDAIEGGRIILDLFIPLTNLHR